MQKRLWWNIFVFAWKMQEPAESRGSNLRPGRRQLSGQILEKYKIKSLSDWGDLPDAEHVGLVIDHLHVLQRLHTLPLLLLVEEHLFVGKQWSQLFSSLNYILADRHVLLLLHQSEQILIVHLPWLSSSITSIRMTMMMIEGICDHAMMIIRILLFNLLNLVGQLKRLLTGEKLNDSIGVEHVTRVNLNVLNHMTLFLLWSDHHRAGLEERYGREVPEKSYS